jgi:hypothetical protein
MLSTSTTSWFTVAEYLRRQQTLRTTSSALGATEGNSMSPKKSALVASLKAPQLQNADERYDCRYATAGTDATFTLISVALVPRFVAFGTNFVQPAIKRLTTKVYTQDDHHNLLLNGEFHLGSAVAEVCLITMHTLTYGAGVPLMYPLAALALLLITVDTKIKLKYMWPLPKRFDVTCTHLFLRVVKAMALVHALFATWMHSYFRMAGQITGASFSHHHAADRCSPLCGHRFKHICFCHLPMC